MIKLPCPACLERLAVALDADTIRNADGATLHAHCQHNGVGISVLANRGVIVDWGLFNALDIEAARERIGKATVGGVLYDLAEAQFVGAGEIKH